MVSLQARRIGETLAQYNRRVGKRPPTTVRRPTPTKQKPVTPTVKKPPTQKVKARVDPVKRQPIRKKPTVDPDRRKPTRRLPKGKPIASIDYFDKDGKRVIVRQDDPPTRRTPRPKRPTVDPRKKIRRPKPEDMVSPGFDPKTQNPDGSPKGQRRRRPPTTPTPKRPVPKNIQAFIEELRRKAKLRKPTTPRPNPITDTIRPPKRPIAIRPGLDTDPSGRPIQPRVPRRPPDTLGGSPVAIGNNIDINKIGNKSRIFEIADRKNRAIRQQLQRLVSATYRRGISPMAKAQAEAQIKIIRNQLSKVKFPKGMGGDGTYTSEMLYALGVFQKGPSRIKRPTPDQIIPMPFAETQPVRRPPDPLGGRDLRDLNRKERAEVVKARYQLTQTERMRNYNNARQNLINRFRNDPAKLRQELSKLNINIRQDDTVRKFRAGLVSRNALNNIGLPPREIQKVIFDRKMSVMPESPRKLDMILNFQIREMNLDLRETIKKMQARGATRQEIQRIRTAYRNEIARRRQNMARAKADLQAYRRTR
tara:strand:+ start:247 stop:1848 length:1602 start_codon:yes stop_codon:yes gene_type:complete